MPSVRRRAAAPAVLVGLVGCGSARPAAPLPSPSAGGTAPGGPSPSGPVPGGTAPAPGGPLTESATGVLTLTLDGRRVVAERWAPLQLPADGVPRAPAQARAEQQEADRAQARGCAHLGATPS